MFTLFSVNGVRENELNSADTDVEIRNNDVSKQDSNSKVFSVASKKKKQKKNVLIIFINF